VLRHPIECIPAFQEALDETIRNQHPKLLLDGQACHITFTGEYGHSKVSPRSLSASLLNTLVSVTGIVTRATLVRPKIVRSVHYAEKSQVWVSRDYRDEASFEGLPTPVTYPTRDDNDNLLTTQFGLSQYIDRQSITLQELPETSPPGQLPRSVEVVLEDDLRDCCKPGDRVSVMGVYKPIAPGMGNGAVSGIFYAKIIATGITRLTRDAGGPTFTEEDYDNITDLAGEEDLMDQLGSSLAPSIYGYGWIKKALVLLLAGGRERTLPNGTHLRGDINCLLVGDPGVAKSQLLRAIMSIAPLSVSTTGRGSSGVGLTAAVTMDGDSGERRLEAGAMVLADRGVVCIDEFDKMNDADRVAIHEVMEQQTVTIAKAGILCSLNARCSVVAAANPIYGHYDRHISITRNIGLPDSLLSRFDLLFVVLDNNDAARDREIAEHVLGQHRYKPAGAETVADEDKQLDSLEEEEQRETGSVPMRVKYDARLYGPRQPAHGGPKRGASKDPLTLQFLRKYIAFAKQRFSAPELTPEASETISEYYADLRNSAEVKALPVTVRTLETVIRLSCAHAKIRLSAWVEKEDVDAVTEVLDIVLKSDPSATNIAQKDKKEKKSAAAYGGGAKRGREGDDDENDDVNAAAGGGVNATTNNNDAQAPASNGNDNNNNKNNTNDDADMTDVETAIREKVNILGALNNGACSATGIKAVLTAEGVNVTREQVMTVLQEMDKAETIFLDGEDFYLAV